MEISGVEKYENESLVCQVDDGVSMGQCLGRYILGGNQLGREPCENQQVFKINREGGTSESLSLISFHVWQAASELTKLSLPHKYSKNKSFDRQISLIINTTKGVNTT